MTRYYVGSSSGLVLRGVAALLFGLATLVWPAVTLWALVLLWGAFALVDGTIALSAAITAVALLVVIGVWALFTGASMIAIAISERKRITGEWLVGLTGLLTVLLGALLLVNPAGGALAITWAIGWYACLYGSLSFGLAWTVHHETKGPVQYAEQRATRSEHSVH